eukprot:6740995-Pyramimonas_sp.AAC.1
MLSKVVQYVVDETVTVTSSNGDEETIKQYSKLRLWIRKEMRVRYGVAEPAEPDAGAEEPATKSGETKSDDAQAEPEA